MIKKKRNTLLVIIVILMASISCWLILNNKNGTIKESLRNFAVADTASITKIILQKAQGETVLLEKKNDNEWLVNEQYIARNDAMKALLFAINKIDVKEPIGKNEADNAIKQLAENAVTCKIYKGETIIKSYYVGEGKQKSSTYMMLINPSTLKASGKPFVIYIPGYDDQLLARYFTDELKWRSLTLFNYIPKTIRSVKLEVPSKPEMGYEVVIDDNNHYQVKDDTGKFLTGTDTASVKQYLSYFQLLSAESFEEKLSEKQKDSILQSPPLNILTVTDKAEKRTQVRFFARAPQKKGELDLNGREIKFDPERMNASLNNSRDFVIVQYYIFGKVFPPVTYFHNPEKH